MTAAMLLLLGAALAADPATATPPAPPGGVAPAPDSSYQLGPGDQLQIQVYGEPPLSGAFPVNDRGELNYPLLGDVSVAGKTADEVATLLHDQLAAGYLVEPSVTVWLDAHNSQPVPVLGAVAEPGLYFLTGKTTVLELLSQAGGVLGGTASEVRVTHGGDRSNVTVVPFQPLVAEGQGNLVLRAGDLVYVPESLVSVMGSVGQPGEVAYRENLTVSQAIAAAGGPTNLANLGHVYVLRGEQRIRVNVRKVLKGRSDDVLVQPGDRVYVKESSF
jgi:polysaccharide export outer membrane protein